MKITIIAETKQKDSYTEENLQFFKQYAIGEEMTEDEKQFFYKTYSMREIYNFSNPVITLRRRVDNRGGNLSFWEWDYFDIFENSLLASRGFGDSEYWQNPTSASELHSNAKIWAEKIESLNNEYEELDKQINGGKFGSGSLLKTKYNDLYESELKAKRLWSKVKQNSAPQNVLDEIKNRLMPLYEAEKSQIESRMNEIKEELKGL